MLRERALRIVLVIVGLIFLAGVYPLITSIREGWQANKEDPLPMGISLYVMQGIFLLLAARDPLSGVRGNSRIADRGRPGGRKRKRYRLLFFPQCLIELLCD